MKRLFCVAMAASMSITCGGHGKKIEHPTPLPPSPIPSLLGIRPKSANIAVGYGYSYLNDQPVSSTCVLLSPRSGGPAGTNSTRVSVRTQNSLRLAEQSMRLSANGKADLSIIGLEASANSSFSQSSTFSETSSVIVVSVEITRAPDAALLTLDPQLAALAANNPVQFVNRCGHGAVSAVTRGFRFDAVITLDDVGTTLQSDLSAIANLNLAGLAQFDASAAGHLRHVEQSRHFQATIETTGGVQLTSMSASSTDALRARMDEFINRANAAGAPGDPIAIDVQPYSSVSGFPVKASLNYPNLQRAGEIILEQDRLHRLRNSLASRRARTRDGAQCDDTRKKFANAISAVDTRAASLARYINEAMYGRPKLLPKFTDPPMMDIPLACRPDCGKGGLADVDGFCNRCTFTIPHTFGEAPGDATAASTCGVFAPGAVISSKINFNVGFSGGYWRANGCMQSWIDLSATAGQKSDFGSAVRVAKQTPNQEKTHSAGGVLTGTFYASEAVPTITIHAKECMRYNCDGSENPKTRVCQVDAEAMLCDPARGGCP